MNAMWLLMLFAVAMAFQTTKDTKGTKEKQLPRLADGSARLGMTPLREMVANRVQHSYVQHYSHPADAVFAVMEPVEEVKWAPGFEFEWVYAKDGPNARAGQEGDVFVTRHHSGLGSQSQAIWVISTRDVKERRVQFVRTIPDFEVTQINIHVIPDGNGAKCEITYAFTALGEQGQQHLRSMTNEHFDAQMAEWEEQVEAYLSHR